MTAYSYKQTHVQQPTDVDFYREIRIEEIFLTSLTTDLIFRSPKLVMVYEEERNLYPMKLFL